MLNKITKTDILLVIIAVLVGYAIFSVKKLNTFDQKSYKEEMSKLNLRFDTLKTNNKIIDGKVSVIDSNITKVKVDLVNTNKQIKTIKYETVQKVNGVNHYTFSDLEKFFADRYEGKK